MLLGWLAGDAYKQPEWKAPIGGAVGLEHGESPSGTWWALGAENSRVQALGLHGKWCLGICLLPASVSWECRPLLGFPDAPVSPEQTHDGRTRAALTMVLDLHPQRAVRG